LRNSAASRAIVGEDCGSARIASEAPPSGACSAARAFQAAANSVQLEGLPPFSTVCERSGS